MAAALPVSKRHPSSHHADIRKPTKIDWYINPHSLPPKTNLNRHTSLATALLQRFVARTGLALGDVLFRPSPAPGKFFIKTGFGLYY